MKWPMPFTGGLLARRRHLLPRLLAPLPATSAPLRRPAPLFRLRTFRRAFYGKLASTLRDSHVGRRRRPRARAVALPSPSPVASALWLCSSSVCPVCRHPPGCGWRCLLPRLASRRRSFPCPVLVGTVGFMFFALVYFLRCRVRRRRRSCWSVTCAAVCSLARVRRRRRFSLGRRARLGGAALRSS